MDNRSVTYGLYAGLGIILVNLGLYFVDSKMMLNYAGYFAWVVYIACMIKAVQEEREEAVPVPQGSPLDAEFSESGYITFKQAFKVTWLVFVIGSILETVFGYVLMNFIDPSLLDEVGEIAIEQTQSWMETFGAPEEEIEKAIEQIEDEGFKYEWWHALMGYGWRLAFPGAVFAAIVSLIFKRTKELD